MPETCPFDIDDPSIVDDPYTMYAEHRATCPVGFSETRGGFWYVTDYESVRAGFRNPELLSNAEIKVPAAGDPMGKYIPVQLDGPLHARWREMLDPLFTLTRMESYRDAIRDEAVRLIVEVVAKGECDFAQMFTIPYPSRMFCLLMGLPPEGLDEYLTLQRDLSGVSAVVRTAPGEERPDRETVVAKYHEARQGVDSIFADLRKERLEHGFREDLVSAILTAEVDGRPVTEQEYHNLTGLLFTAGLETVTATLGNIVVFLADHPEHRRRLVQDPSLIPSAVEEFLRYESIVAPGRVVTTDGELGGQHMRAGDRVMLITGSAGRDEKVFENADEVVFERSPNRHLAFGGGPHRCLGSHLARMELRVALTEMCSLMPEFMITPGLAPVRSLGQIKALDVLPLTIGTSD
jgi:cytochrome P450